MDKDKTNYDPVGLLCEQIELLAKESKDADTKTLIEISNAMADLYRALNS